MWAIILSKNTVNQDFSMKWTVLLLCTPDNYNSIENS